MMRKTIVALMCLLALLSAAALAEDLEDSMEIPLPANYEEYLNDLSGAAPEGEHHIVDGLVQTNSRPASDPNTIVISMVGDCTVGEQYKYRGYKTNYTYNINLLGLDYPFRHVAALFEKDDLTIANCEGAFTNRRLPSGAKEMSLCADPSFAQVLAYGNVDVCNLSNNHAGDFGEGGKNDTIEALRAVGIDYFDETTTYVTEIKGVKIGIASTCFPLSDVRVQRLIDKLNRLKQEEGVSFTIASIHWGQEDSRKINAQQKTYGHRFIDQGVDMVYGHGSHTLQPVQYYKGHMILYSTSNFTFGANRNPKDPDTAVFQVTFRINRDNTLTAAALNCLPFKMYGTGAPNFETGKPTGKRDFSPVPVEDEAERLKVLAKLVFTAKNDPNTNLPESFKTTGYADLLAWQAELDAAGRQ